MKELSIEEKAKAYDKALAIARNFYNSTEYAKSHAEVKATYEAIFPELKEGEDDRIRKSLIGHLKECRNNTRSEVMIGEYAKWIAWLENQGEQQDVSIQINPSEYINDMGGNGCYLKNTTQKPADKVEPKFKHGDKVRNKKSGLEQTLGSCIEDVYEGAFPFRIKDQDDWELVEQNLTWSEEDDEIITEIASILINQMNCVDSIDEENRLSYLADKIKSLRPQINVTDEELAKAKKDAYNDALDKIEYHSGEPTFDDGWGAAIWYLKKRNALPQNTWKPSDEQMERLKGTINSLPHQEVLYSLYQDLKKLKGE